MSSSLTWLEQLSEARERKALGTTGLSDSWAAWLFCIFICQLSEIKVCGCIPGARPGNRTSVCCGWTCARLFHAEHQRQLIYERGRLSSCSQQVIPAMCNSCVLSIRLYLGSADCGDLFLKSLMSCSGIYRMSPFSKKDNHAPFLHQELTKLPLKDTFLLQAFFLLFVGGYLYLNKDHIEGLGGSRSSDQQIRPVVNAVDNSCLWKALSS